MEGIDLVLLHLGEICKGLRRQQYVQWVYAHLIDPFDVPLQMAIVEELIRRLPQMPSENVAETDPWEWIDLIPALVEAVQEQAKMTNFLRSSPCRRV